VLGEHAALVDRVGEDVSADFLGSDAPTVGAVDIRSNRQLNVTPPRARVTRFNPCARCG
jgi:hypothetical protein